MADTERQSAATLAASDVLEYRPSVRPGRSNHVAMLGRLTTDPVLRRTTSDVAVTHLRLATNDRGRADFFDVVAWRDIAEVMAKLTKGQQIALGGRLQTRTWKGNDDVNRHTVEIVAEEFRTDGTLTA